MTATRSTAMRMDITMSERTGLSWRRSPSGVIAIPAADPHHNTGQFNRGVDVDQRSALEQSFSSLILTSIAQAWSQAAFPQLAHKKSGLAFSRPWAYRHSGSSLNWPSVAATHDGRVYREPTFGKGEAATAAAWARAYRATPLGRSVVSRSNAAAYRLARQFPHTPRGVCELNPQLGGQAVAIVGAIVMILYYAIFSRRIY